MTVQSSNQPVIVLDSFEAVQGLKQGDICKLSPTAETTFFVDMIHMHDGLQIYLTTTDSREEEYIHAGCHANYFLYFKHMRGTYQGPVIYGPKNIWKAIQTGRYIIG